MGKKACAAAAGSTSEVARGDAIRVKRFGEVLARRQPRRLPAQGGRVVQVQKRQNIRAIIEQHSAKGGFCSITATPDSSTAASRPPSSKAETLASSSSVAVDSTEPAPVPSMSRMPSHLANTTSRETRGIRVYATAAARRGKEKRGLTSLARYPPTIPSTRRASTPPCFLAPPYPEVPRARRSLGVTSM